MAGLYRRNTLAAIVLPLLLLAMSGIGRAAGTVTNCTTFGPAAGTLQAALTGGGTVMFACSGTIIMPPLVIAFGTTTIDATGQAVTLSGNNANRVFAVSHGATLNLTSLTVAQGNGNGGSGGGIFNNGTMTVTNCTFSDNVAPTGLGGGIDNVDGSVLTVTNSTFSGNTAVTGAGGAISSVGTLTVTNSTFSRNSASMDGGGIFADGATTVTNSTFSDNSTVELGGAIENSVGPLTVTNCTFSGNSAGVGGGGIDNEPLGTTSLKGSILAADPGGNCSGLINDAGYNISDDLSCPVSSGTSVDNSTALNLDPAGLQNNGGPTRTIAIEPNSQALDFIPVASCKDQEAIPQPLTQDQRGFPRPDSGNTSFCDAGAFELQTGRITVVPGSEKTQIARSTTANSDQVNLAFTFFDDGSPVLLMAGAADGVVRCDAGNNALNGINVDLFEGTCAELPTATGGLLLDLSPFVVHTIGASSYGTLFQSDPPDMLQQTSETVSARIVKQSLPIWVETCGEWTVNIEVAGLDTKSTEINLGGSNPFALVIEDGDKNEGCFDITNAIVGNQIGPPRKVRRGARR